MEGLPFRLSAILILGAIVLSIAFFELSTFTQFSERKQFADDVVNLVQSMRVVSTGGDYGSFTRAKVRVPQGSNVIFDNSTNKLVVLFYGELREYPVPGQLVLYRRYPPADYNLVIYYGRPSNSSDPLLVAIR